MIFLFIGGLEMYLITSITKNIIECLQI
uniref:Uncharacterized protein n=1 Tax=Rhizophora mucronata TaxID=61149 RepID=A0A2P2QG68_RHIMU